MYLFVCVHEVVFAFTGGPQLLEGLLLESGGSLGKCMNNRGTRRFEGLAVVNVYTLMCVHTFCQFQILIPRKF